MKKPLLVTLADRKYLEYAKQVFAGAYFNAGWKGDYMLLAHDCRPKDTIWFRRKGILVKHCKPIYQRTIADTNPAIISKLYLFTPEFKKWSQVIYYDVDIIIRSSLDNLLKSDGFAAVDDISHAKLLREIISPGKAKIRGLGIKGYKQLQKKLLKKFNFNRRMFGAGMFVLNTRIIKKNTFNVLINLIEKYHYISADADMFALNIYFYGKWQRLPAIYDMCLYNQKNQWELSNSQLKGFVLHFCTHKPWARNNYFYREWKKNLDLADKINLLTIPKGIEWGQFQTFFFLLSLHARESIITIRSRKYLTYNFLISYYYKLVHFIERVSPKFFRILKTTKARFRSQNHD